MHTHCHTDILGVVSESCEPVQYGQCGFVLLCAVCVHTAINWLWYQVVGAASASADYVLGTFLEGYKYENRW